MNVPLTTAAGLRGLRAAMEAVYGPFSEETDGAFDEWFAALGDDWEIERGYFKTTPSCRYIHPALGALQQLEAEIDRNRVDRIDVHTFRNACDLSYSTVTNYTSAKFSIPFVLARYLVSGELWLDDFTGDALTDSETRALAERVHLHRDPKYERAFPSRWSARVEVVHGDGRTVEAECIDPPGDFRRPPADDELRTLFRELLRWRFDDDTANETLTTLLDVRQRDVRSVGATLRR